MLRDSLEQVEMAIDDGLDIRGLFHWTGVDNYEWDFGYDVAFGLFDRDRAPKAQRRPGPSLGHRHGADRRRSADVTLELLYIDS